MKKKKIPHPYIPFLLACLALISCVKKGEEKPEMPTTVKQRILDFVRIITNNTSDTSNITWGGVECTGSDTCVYRFSTCSASLYGKRKASCRAVLVKNNLTGLDENRSIIGEKWFSIMPVFRETEKKIDPLNKCGIIRLNFKTKKLQHKKGGLGWIVQFTGNVSLQLAGDKAMFECDTARWVIAFQRMELLSNLIVRNTTKNGESFHMKGTHAFIKSDTSYSIHGIKRIYTSNDSLSK